MRVISINIAKPRGIPGAEAAGTSGIYKQPQPGPVRVSKLGLDGDAVCHTRDHGGEDQAIYAYGSVDYAWWEETLGSDLQPGTFGENLTIEGMDSTLHVGDRLAIADTVLEATAPRIP